MTPSNHNRIIFVLALAGVGVALALTISHATAIDLPCTVTHGCEEVARDPSAHGFGIPFLKAIPTAAFGLLMYILLAGLSFLRAANADASTQRLLAGFQWLLSLGGVVVTAYLMYLEAYVIHAWCQWCLASAAIITTIFITASLERFGHQGVSIPVPGGEAS